MRNFLTSLVFGVFAISSTAHADIRGLVIGIDEYVTLTNLQGATADARDVAQALSGLAQTRDVRTLIDGQATRSAIERHWQDLVDMSRPGDWIVFHYAGHGGQEDEHVPGSERDGKDETFLLAAFSERGAGTRERILDNELAAWVMDAEARGIRVLLSADSCHSGGMSRSTDPRGTIPNTRLTRYELGEDLLSLDIDPSAATAEPWHFENAVFLGASLESEVVPEIYASETLGTPPTPRGAMSYALARALEGHADRNRDGQLSSQELFSYVSDRVRALAESRQTPELRVADDDLGDTLFAVPGATQTEMRLSAPRPRLMVINGDVSEDVFPSNASRVTELAQADLIYDADARDLLSTAPSDVLADNLRPSLLSSAVERWGAVEALRSQCGDGGLQSRILPDNRVHQEGSQIGYTLSPVSERYIILFNLAGDGKVQMQYPRANTPEENATRESTLALDGIPVSGPYGADHLVAIVSDSAMTQELDALRRLHGRRAAWSAATIACNAATRADTMINIQGLFTQPR